MIKVEKDAKLTPKNLAAWYLIWKEDRARLIAQLDMYLNKQKLKLPFAKKLVTTSAAAALGEGMTISIPDNLGTPQKKVFEKIQDLFKKQTIISQDANIIKHGCICGRSYELVYMSSDEEPVPKTALFKGTNAFVVGDDTVENNSLYGVCFSEYKDGTTNMIRFDVYDKENIYEYRQAADNIGSINVDVPLEAKRPHNIGRMPLTEYLNNDEEQGDFEQVMELITDRTDIHNLNMEDMKQIAKNYLYGHNIRFAGDTEEEKKESQRKAYEQKLIEAMTDGENPKDGISLLSKPDSYGSIDVFGGDVDSKIYDLSLIPDLTSEQFAGNITGVALEFKLMPFQKMVEAKNSFIERLYRRRLKMYLWALTQGESGWFDAADITIDFNRNWTKNIVELATLIQTLQSTGLFSDKYLTNKMPDADYDEEQEQRKIEQEEKANNPDPNNATLADYNAVMRQMQGGAVDVNNE